MATLTRYGAVAAGTAFPMVARATLDDPGSALFRPSVLVGVGLGGLSLAYGYFARRGDAPALIGSRSDTMAHTMLFGTAALTGGVLSVVTPSGGGGFAAPSA